MTEKMADETTTAKVSPTFSGVAWFVVLLLIVSLGTMQPFVFVALQKLSPTDLIFPFALMLWVGGLVFQRIRLRIDHSYWFLAAYFAAMALSSIFSVNPSSSYIKLIGEGYLLGIAVLIFNQLTSETRLKHAVFTWLAGTVISLIVAAITVALFYIQPDHWLLGYTTYHFGAVPVINFPRVSSTFVSASMFCDYLNVSVVLVFVAREKNWIGRKTQYGLVLAITLAALSTISIGIGGVFLAIGAAIWLTKGKDAGKLPLAALLAGIAIAVVFAVSSFVALKPHATAPYSWNIPIVGTVYPSPRTLVWTESLKTFVADPIFGKGLNQPVCAVPFQNTDGSYSLLTDAHNIYLSVAAQNGTLGLLAMPAICIFMLRLGFRSQDTTVRLLCVAFATAFVYQGLTGAYEDARHLWALVGITIAASKLGRGTEQGLTHSTRV